MNTSRLITCLQLASRCWQGTETLALVFGLIVGVIFALLAIFLFDWVIITLSSLAGAALLVQAFLAEGGSGGVIFTILFLIGVIVQGSVLRSKQH